MPLPLITIGMPTYNRANGYLKQALLSAINQTYKNIEIIVSDNCSSDNTEHVVKKFKDPRLRYIRHSHNIGANNNFNFCLNQAKGHYFLLLHDDDMIDEDFMESCMEYAKGRTDIGLIRTGVRVIDQNGKVIAEKENSLGGLSAADFILAWLDRKMPLLLCGSLFNTEGLRQIGGFNSKHQLFQDVLAELKMVSRYERMDVPEIKATFRRHSSQRTHVKKIRYWCEDSMFLLEEMCALAPQKRNVIIHKGIKFFAQHNYNIASKIQSPIKKLIAYSIVYRGLKYKYSPLRFYYDIYSKKLRNWTN